MKQKKYLIFKKLSLLFLLFGTIIACTNDEFINNLENSKNYKKTRINLEQLKRIKPNVANKVIGFKERKANRTNSRTIHDNINGFSFNTDNMLLIENGSQYWLTVPIIRDSIISNAPLENLLLTPQNNGNFLPLILQYQLTESDIILLSNNQPIPNILSKTTINSLDNYDSNLYNNVTNKIVYSGDPDYSGTIFHDEFGNCYVIDNVWQNPDGSLGWDYIQITCPTNTGGSGGSDTGDTGGGTGIGTGGGDVIIYDGTGSSGTGASGSTSSDDGFGGSSVTSPTGGGGDVEAGLNCAKIHNQFAKHPSLKQSLINLATTTNQNHENGISIYDTAQANSANAIQNLPQIGGGSVDFPNPPSPNKYYMVAHTHDISGSDGLGTYSIFSWLDLSVLAKRIKEGFVDSNNLVFYLFTADGTYYAITIEDAQGFADTLYLNTQIGQPFDVEKAKFLNDIKDDTYGNPNESDKITKNSDKNNDLIKFLKMMKKLNLNNKMSLYETDSNLSFFNKLSLKSNTPIRKPCEN